MTEKDIHYQSTNSYSTLNTMTEETTHVWFVCHGMGYLSRYFLKYFSELPPKQHYIIAPQAPSKYYLPPTQKHVGGSWLTKENTVKETANVMRYFDAVLENEAIGDKHIVVLGYSQGVSVALRYVAQRKLEPVHIVIMSGGIPKELDAKDFAFLKKETRVTLVYGESDEYLNAERIAYETERARELFGGLRLNIIPFEGKHEVKMGIINGLEMED